MTKSSLLFITLVLTLANYHLTTVGCFRWSERIGCYECYQRQRTRDNCGPLLPKNNPCLSHLEYEGQRTNCNICAPGYALAKTDFGGLCVKGTIFNCVVEVVKEHGGSTCVACGEGEYPVKNSTQCAPISNPTPNCELGGTLTEFGGVGVGSGRPQCYKCDPGNALDYFNNRCLAWNSTTTGCWEINHVTGKCMVCDDFGGYSMQKDGSCLFIQEKELK